MISLSLLMMFCTVNTAYAVADSDPRGWPGRGGRGASGRPEIPREKGPQGAVHMIQEAKKSHTLQQLSRATWRTELNRTGCTGGRAHGALGDNRFILGGDLWSAQQRTEEPRSANDAETPTRADSADNSRANRDISRNQKFIRNVRNLNVINLNKSASRASLQTRVTEYTPASEPALVPKPSKGAGPRPLIKGFSLALKAKVLAFLVVTGVWIPVYRYSVELQSFFLMLSTRIPVYRYSVELQSFLP